MGRGRLLLLLLIFFLAGCGGPRTAPASDPTAELRLPGIGTPYSVPLSELGDRELLGDDSAMRDALVAGDDDFYVAASAYRSTDVVGVDLVLVNNSGQEFLFTRDDLHLVDARGRWLPVMADWEPGRRHGLRAKRNGASGPAVYEVADRAAWTDPSQGLGEPGEVTPRPVTKRLRPSATRPRSQQDDEPESLAPTAPDPFDGALRAVRVPDGAGRVFWGYFDAAGAEYPLTAVVMRGDAQLVFRFESPSAGIAR